MKKSSELKSKGIKSYNETDFESAIIHFTNAIKMEENPELYYQRGLSYLHNKQLEKSLIDFNTCVELEPENPFRYSSRAYIKSKSGDVIGAIEDYKIAIQLDPKDSIAFNNLGLLEEQLGYDKESSKHFKKADLIAEADKFFEEKKESIGLERTNPNKISFQKEKMEFQSKFELIKAIFTKKETLNEFITFIKMGFKLK